MNRQNAEMAHLFNSEFCSVWVKRKHLLFLIISLPLNLEKKTESEFIDPVKFIWEMALKPRTKINSNS